MNLPEFKILQTEADLLTVRGRLGRWKEKRQLNDTEVTALKIVDNKLMDACEILKALREGR